MKSRRFLQVLLFAAGLALAPCAPAALNAYMKIDGAPGESMEPKHMGWIEVSSPQLDQIRNSMTVGSATGGAGAGKIKFNEFTIKKRTDKATPKLLEAAVKGKVFHEVVIHMFKAGGGQQQYLVIKLENCLVSSYRTGGAGGAGPEESFNLSFASATLQDPIVSTPRTTTKVTPAVAPAVRK